MPSKSKTIQISFLFNDKENTVPIETNETISNVKILASKFLSINFNDYDIYYLKNQLRLAESQDNLKVKELIGNDTNPAFFIQKSASKPINII